MKGAEELDPSNKGGTRGGGGGTSARLENHPNLEAGADPPLEELALAHLAPPTTQKQRITLEPSLQQG